MRDGLDTPPRPPSVEREPSGPVSVSQAQPGSGQELREASTDAPFVPSGQVPWGTLFVWLSLAVGAWFAEVRYTSPAAPDGVLSPGRGPFESMGAFGLVVGVVGCAMIVTGVLIYAFRESGDRGGRSPFAVHAFLCSLGGFYVLLADGVAFVGTGALSTWAVMVVIASMAAGWYLLRWLPESRYGGELDWEQLARRRQGLLHRLWTMTDVAPERIEALLGREVPMGEVGSYRALKASLRYQFRPVWRRRRFDATVAILGVPAAAAPEALLMVAEQSRIQALLRLGTPLRSLLDGWRKIHVPVGLAAAILVAARLVFAAMGQAL